MKRSQMNLLVMDYLVAEGFKEAAERFKAESGVEMTRIGCDAAETPELLDQRIEIRVAIEEGRIIDAIKLVNKCYPELLDANRTLYFKLQVRCYDHMPYTIN